MIYFKVINVHLGLIIYVYLDLINFFSQIYSKYIIGYQKIRTVESLGHKTMKTDKSL